MMNRLRIYLWMVFIFIISSCATVPKEADIIFPERGEVLSQEEQQQKSIEKFNEILLVSRSAKDRKTVLPEMEDLYLQIIVDYPDAPLVHEVYWKLIKIYVDDYSPPAYKKAETLYAKFTNDYPDSPLRGFVDRTLSVSYYRNKEWNRLLTLTTPAFRAYTEDGKRPTALLIFMYAEANFHLGDFKAAEKGFRIVMEKFPELNENEKARQRIDYIRRRM